MTYVLGDTATSQVYFGTFSQVPQTIDYAGKTVGNQVFGYEGNYVLVSNMFGPNALVTLASGTLNTNGYNVDVRGIHSFSPIVVGSGQNLTRTLILGASQITLNAKDLPINFDANNFTLNAGTSRITFTNAVNGIAAVMGFGLTYYNLVVNANTGPQAISLGGSYTCHDLTVIGGASKIAAPLVIDYAVTVTGTLTLQGNSVLNRLLVKSATLGTAVSVNAAAVALTNVDIFDISASGAASPWVGASLGDCQGNSGITFTPAQTQTHVAGAGGNWSDVTKWTSRVPLPQDNVVVDVNTTGTLTADMPRLGKDLIFTGFLGQFATTVLANAFYGSLNLASGMTWVSTKAFAASGRGNRTLNSAGLAIPGSFEIRAPNGVYTQQADISYSGTGAALGVYIGTYNDNGYNVTFSSLTTGFFQAVGDQTILLLLSGIWTFMATAGTLYTISGLQIQTQGLLSTFVVGSASANTRFISCSSGQVGKIVYTVAGSTGILSIGGSNIRAIEVSPGHKISMVGPSAYLLTNIREFNVQGSAGNLTVVESSTPGVQTKLVNSSGQNVNCDYLDLKDSLASGDVIWYAGSHSINSGNNTGWLFIDGPVQAVGTVTTTGKASADLISSGKASGQVNTTGQAAASLLYKAVVDGTVNTSGNSIAYLKLSGNGTGLVSITGKADADRLSTSRIEDLILKLGPTNTKWTVGKCLAL